MCNKCRWQEWIPGIARLLNSEKAASWKDYLTATLRNVQTNHHITKAQANMCTQIERRTQGEPLSAEDMAKAAMAALKI